MENIRPRICFLSIYDILVRKIKYSSSAAILMAFPFMVGLLYVRRDLICFHVSYLGLFCALLWMVFAPYLIRRCFNHIIEILFVMKALDKDIDVQEEVDKIQGRLWVRGWGLVLPILVVIFLWLTVVDSASPVKLQIWILITFAYLSHMAGVSIGGIFSLKKSIADLMEHDINVELFHADGLGGLGFLNKLFFKIVFLYYSGILLFFMVYDTWKLVKDWQRWGIVTATVVYVAVGIVTSIGVNINMKRRLKRAKDTKILESEKKIEKMVSESNFLDIVGAYFYYKTYHTRLLEVKFSLIEKDFYSRVLLPSLMTLIVSLFQLISKLS